MVFLLLGAGGVFAAVPDAKITAGMSLGDAERRLAAYGAVPIEVGISRPIRDVFPHYKLRDGRVFSFYGKQVCPREWTITFIDEVMWTVVKVGHGSGYSYQRVDAVSLDEVSLSAIVRERLKRKDVFRIGDED